MKKLYLLVVLAGIAGVSVGQSPSNPGQSPSNPTQVPADTSVVRLVRAFKFVDSALSHLTLTYDVTEPDIPKEVKDIVTRFDSAVTSNKKWFDEYRKNYASGSQSPSPAQSQSPGQPASGNQPLPYNERFGITREEYTRLQQLEKQPPHLITLAQTTVTTTRDKNVLHFKGDGEARILAYLEVDLQQQRIIFAGDTLPFMGPMTTSQLASFQLTQGYSWRFRKVDVNNSLQSYKITARVSEVDMGTPTEGGRTYLRISYQDVKEGVSQANLDLTGFVH